MRPSHTLAEPKVHESLPVAGVSEEQGIVAADDDLTAELAEPYCARRAVADRSTASLASFNPTKAILVDRGGIEFGIRVQGAERAAGSDRGDSWADE